MDIWYYIVIDGHIGQSCKSSTANCLHNAPKHPIVVHDEEDRPQNAIDTYNGMEVHIGRISYNDGNLRMVILGNNLVRGAAGITILTLETMKQMNLI